MATKAFDFGELRSLLQRAPSAQVWEELCALVFPAKWEKAAEQWLPYAEDALERGWPDPLRELPKEWIGRKNVAAAKLCRHLRIQTPSARHIRQYTELLERNRPPITRLTLRDVRHKDSMDTQMAQQLWAALDSLGSIEELVVMRGDVRGPSVEALLGGSIPGRLRALRLQGGPVSAAEALALVGATNARTLRALELDHLQGGAAGLGAVIADAGLCETLEELTITTTRLEAADLAALAGQRWPMLRVLGLGAALDETAHEALYRLIRQAPGLKRLELAHDGVDDALAERLAALEGVELEALGLGAAKVSAEGLAALLASPLCAKLQALSAYHLCASEAVGAAIVGSSMTQTLERLGLEGADVADTFWEELARAELPRLRKLELTGTRITRRGERALLKLRTPALGWFAYGPAYD